MRGNREEKTVIVPFPRASGPSFRLLFSLSVIALIVLAGLGGCGGESAAPEQDDGITGRMLVAPDALVGPGPSNLNWSPQGAELAYVEPRDGKDVLWLYDASSGEKRVLLDPADHPDKD